VQIILLDCWKKIAIGEVLQEGGGFSYGQLHLAEQISGRVEELKAELAPEEC